MNELSSDLEIKIINENPVISWGTEESMIGTRNVENTKGLIAPEGYYDPIFIWLSKVSIQLPKGYSALIMHPLNRYDLPFITLGGIVDADHTISNTNIPFFLKKGFEGIIERGTPIAQIIPFKRENWISQKDKDLFINNYTYMKESRLHVTSLYKKKYWHKKNYE